MLRPAPTHGQDWSAYLPFVDPVLRAEVEQLSSALRGCRVVHINATPTGGGVAEMLVGLMPVLRSLGVEASWYTLPPDEGFFQVTKRLRVVDDPDVGGHFPHAARHALERRLVCPPASSGEPGGITLERVVQPLGDLEEALVWR